MVLLPHEKYYRAIRHRCGRLLLCAGGGAVGMAGRGMVPRGHRVYAGAGRDGRCLCGRALPLARRSDAAAGGRHGAFCRSGGQCQLFYLRLGWHSRVAVLPQCRRLGALGRSKAHRRARTPVDTAGGLRHCPADVYAWPRRFHFPHAGAAIGAAVDSDHGRDSRPPHRAARHRFWIDAGSEPYVLLHGAGHGAHQGCAAGAGYGARRPGAGEARRGQPRPRDLAGSRRGRGRHGGIPPQYA